MNGKRMGALGLSLALTLSLTVTGAAAISFTDVPATNWAYQYINDMSDRALAKGYEDGSYKPDAKMTAAETLLFCARVTQVDNYTQTKIAEKWASQMSNLLPDSYVSWASKEMAVAVEAGVLSLSELSSLSQSGALQRTIARQDICKYLVRAMGLEPLAKSLSNYPLTFKDKSSISADLQPYVYVLTNYSVVKGDDKGNFNPDGAVTRAEMTTLLSRSMDCMREHGIVTELPAYTTYDWKAGVITAVSAGTGSDMVLTLNSEVSGLASYTLSSGTKIFEDNMLTTSSALKAGKYVRLNMSGVGTVNEARIGGAVTSYTGSVEEVSQDSLTLQTSAGSQTLAMDRFTEVMVGKTAGDRTLIDTSAGYTSASCWVDAMGHLAAVKLSGGTQMTSGLMSNLSTVSGVTTLEVAAPSGVAYRYTVPAGTPVTVNGSLGTLSSTQIGAHVDLRVSNDSTAVSSVAVDTVTTYVQGPIDHLGTTGSARTVYITDRFTKKNVSYNMSTSAAITYDGEVKSISNIKNDWFVTDTVNGGLITRMEAFPASTDVEGKITAIRYGTPTTLEVTQADNSILTYDLDLTDLPTITRNNRDSSLDKLATGDLVTLTIRYNELTRIEATAQSANATGTVDKVSFETGSTVMEVTLSSGEQVTYNVADGASVTQNGSTTNIYQLKPGYRVAMVTDGGRVTSIDITGTTTSGNALAGTVLTVNGYTSSGRTITLLVSTNPVTVNASNANVMESNGAYINLNSLSAGDSIVVYGAYNGASFDATIIIRQ